MDTGAAIVSSSNLTATAGYSVDFGGDWRNEELGVLLRDEDQSLADLEQQFSLIWDSATSIDPDTVGIVMDFPNVQSFSFVAIRDVRQGSYVTVNDGQGNLAIGQIAQITAYNRSFPHMGQTLWLTQCYAGAAADHRGSVEIPDLQSLFSHPVSWPNLGRDPCRDSFEGSTGERQAALRLLAGGRRCIAGVAEPPGVGREGDGIIYDRLHESTSVHCWPTSSRLCVGRNGRSCQTRKALNAFSTDCWQWKRTSSNNGGAAVKSCSPARRSWALRCSHCLV